MSAKRYELSQVQWERIATLVPGKAGDPGRTASDNRRSSTGCCGCCARARTGALPERYGKWKTAHKRFSRWSKAGVWDRVFADLIKDRDNQYLMIDSTLVRAHQQAATGKGGAAIRLWGAPEAD